MKIRSPRIYAENKTVDGYLEIEGGRIVRIGEGGCDDAWEPGGYVIPGMFDTHIHGTQGYLPCNEDGSASRENIDGFLKGAASEGVTSIFPTLYGYMPQGKEAVESVALLRQYAEAKECSGARIVGIHYEGPYLHRVGEQGAPVEPAKIDLDYVKKVIEAGGGWLKLMGLAPELPGAYELIDLLVNNGVTAAIAHSDCDSAAAFAAYDRGISVATHLCNVMVGVHHRNVGGLGAALVDNRVNTELICDGMHVCNDMLKIVLQAKPNDHIMIISDCTGYSGAPKGSYDSFWGEGGVTIDEQGFVREPGGRIRGSSKSALYGVRNLVKNIGVPTEQALKMASLNPCRKYGIADRGCLRPGNFADFVVIDDDFNVLYTFVDGKMVYDASTERDKIFNKKILENRREH